MNTKQTVDMLWREFRKAINESYKLSNSLDTDCLRDYAEDISWHDGLAALLGRETANERQHRSNRPSVAGFSNETAAKLIIMDNAAKGSILSEMPSATIFLTYRQTAAESIVLGYLARVSISVLWRKDVDSLDYAKLMQPSREVA